MNVRLPHGDTPLSAIFDKRWQNRHERWAPPESRDLFRPAEFGVDITEERNARDLVCQHHYSGSFPAARLSIGLYRKTGVAPAALVGVAVFSVPMQGAAITRYTGLPPTNGVELGRFVCTPEVAFNGETWFLRRALPILRAEKGVAAVLSYADPMERTTAGGELTKPAHVGQIYQAHNATFAGRAAARWLWIDRNGQVVSPRALSKIRLQERGHAYAERQIMAAGVDARRPGEEPADWLRRVLREPTFRRVKHPGNFAYAFGLTREARATIKLANPTPLPFPRLRHVARQQPAASSGVTGDLFGEAA
ncbi:Mom family adenine methylcarbamoylation protein [Azospirillum argentinense]|uniref:Mom family adenine methylcarbamoylation protein n=1 Tax=Azospirillum argentinense TaxID=2970906 RepID=UPI0015860005|nr:hypothetical protein [Azospirillum argentinense]